MSESCEGPRPWHWLFRDEVLTPIRPGVFLTIHVTSLNLSFFVYEPENSTCTFLELLGGLQETCM